MKMALLLLASIVSICSIATGTEPSEAAAKPIKTRWSETIDSDKVLTEYPRPQMVRAAWKNLNGTWDFAITDREALFPKEVSEKILVPFPVESTLSGVKKRVTEKKRMWYRRSFTVSSDWKEQRVLLHFGAVDWETIVYVNGQEVGNHTGGYTPFSFDITDYLKEGEQELVIRVWDPTNHGGQPTGKQTLYPGKIWYTPVSGIWQTVWIEPVPEQSIDSFEVIPDIDDKTLTVKTIVRGHKKDVRHPENKSKFTVKFTALADGKEVATAEAEPLEPATLKIDNPKLWCPDEPFLYDLKIELFHKDTQADSSKPIDVVRSYFGMRKIALAKDEKGIQRLFLNNKPLFQFGPLDQGWWPDGLYTAPADEALIYDIEMTKKLGMNMIRKHVKVEPARWYYHCDRLGMLVWQDMPSKSPRLPNTVDHLNFRKELTEVIESFRFFPCIVMWVPYNEGWGQYEAEKIASMVKLLDPTRLVNHASGWIDKGVGDVCDIHPYPGPKMPNLEEHRASVLGEFGGLGLPVEGHLWQQKKNWGYRTYKDRQSLNDALNDLITKLAPLVKKGVAAAVYTQTSDVEGEVNGLMTYDRDVMKVDVNRFRKNAEELYKP